MDKSYYAVIGVTAAGLFYMYSQTTKTQESGTAPPTYNSDPLTTPSERPPYTGSVVNTIPAPVTPPATPATPATPPPATPPPATPPPATPPPATPPPAIDTTCPYSFKKVGDGSACWRDGYGYCSLWGNPEMYPCSSIKIVMQNHGGALPTCPDGWSRYGDGSACFNGNETYPIRCDLWGNDSLRSCNYYKPYNPSDQAQIFFDAISDAAYSGNSGNDNSNNSYFTDW